MSLIRVQISADEFNVLRFIQATERTDCHAAFTVIPEGSIWPFASLGNTPGDYRQDARGCSKVLEQIAEQYLLHRPEGGRFFIDKEGAFYRVIGGEAGTRFIEFDFIEHAPTG